MLPGSDSGDDVMDSDDEIPAGTKQQPAKDIAALAAVAQQQAAAYAARQRKAAAAAAAAAAGVAVLGDDGGDGSEEGLEDDDMDGEGGSSEEEEEEGAAADGSKRPHIYNAGETRSWGCNAPIQTVHCVLVIMIRGTCQLCRPLACQQLA